MKKAQRIEDVLTILYDYDYIDIEKFYNAKENMELLEVLNSILYNKEPSKIEDEMLDELYNNIDEFIKFETNNNSTIGDF